MLQLIEMPDPDAIPVRMLIEPPAAWVHGGRLGALINMFLVWMFDIGFIAHLVLGGLIAFFNSTMFCLIAIMDNPYRGDISVPPKAFQLIYDGLMKKPAI